MGSAKLGQILLKTKVIAQDQLEQALHLQTQSGERLGNILVNHGMVQRLDVFQALAAQLNTAFFSFSFEDYEQNFDVSLLGKISHRELIGHQALPGKLEGNTLTILTANPDSPDTLAFFRERFRVPHVRQVVITDLDVVSIVKRFFQHQVMDEAIWGLHRRFPRYSAFKVFSEGQWLVLSAGLLGSLLWLYFDGRSLVLSLFLLLQVFYVANIGFRTLLCAVGSRNTLGLHVTPEQTQALESDKLPIYTILVPVYQEPEVIPALIGALKNLDYPKDKLDVLLLLEDTDNQTIEAAKAAAPPANWRFILIPSALPQTKPKACNYGLQFARGEYVVIYDAEDIPDPDQLKAAVVASRQLGDSCLCIQAALNYYNAKENFITGLFTLEYCYQYDYLLPGLDALGLPIPLGGTSNHFRTEMLRELGGWDPFNTTEDAELGMRAYVHGYRVGLIDSTTYEEANSTYWNWVRQRSRWLKGHLQTALVYSRHPYTYIRSMGWARWFAGQFLMAGTSLMLLANPIIWTVCLFSLLAPESWISLLHPPPMLLLLGMFNLAISNFLGVYFNMLGVFKRRYFSFLPLALMNPLYWLFFHSIAAYKALWQLFARPHYWEKTDHGLSHFKTPKG